ncbi:hypothetical protein [Lacinutrix algicola]|uniref:hypothetical protein n=1 Tax=Lacinutrix algicola TaxID=342954 RepID=UPI000A647495|nr:hypothetical protein [Lacinutrix algicola]
MRKKKKLTPKRILKFVAGTVIFLTLPTLLLFGFLYIKYNEDLPVGEKTAQADVLANKMLNALNYDAYKTTDYIEFTFKKRHHYKWNKTENTCEVYWKNYKVNLDLNDSSKSEAFQNDIKIETQERNALIEKAISYFNNDTFWVVAPYKVFDEGTTRSIVTLENNEQALLVTYSSGGSTPGDSYLWHLDEAGKPKSFQMWVGILPINGLEASWSDWTTTETGAMLPTFHKMMVLGLEIEGIKTIPDSGRTYYYPNTEYYINSEDKTEISLDSIKDFKSIIKKIDSITCTEKTAVVTLKTEKSTFKFIPFSSCKHQSNWCPKGRNLIEVSPGKIVHSSFGEKSIDSLPRYLEKHLLNNGKDIVFSENLTKPVMIFTSDSTKNRNELKNTFQKIFEDFNSINKSSEEILSLRMVLYTTSISDLPPPPRPK